MPAPKFIDDPAYRDLRDNDFENFREHIAGRKQIDFTSADLRGVDLRNVDVSKLILRDAYLRDADLRGLDLRQSRYGRLLAARREDQRHLLSRQSLAARNRQQRALRHAPADECVLTRRVGTAHHAKCVPLLCSVALCGPVSNDHRGQLACGSKFMIGVSGRVGICSRRNGLSAALWQL